MLLARGKYNRDFCFWTHLRNWVKLLSWVSLLAYANIRTTATLESHALSTGSIFPRHMPTAFNLIVSGMLWSMKHAISYFVSTGFFFFISTAALFLSILGLAHCVGDGLLHQARGNWKVQKTNLFNQILKALSSRCAGKCANCKTKHVTFCIR